jgi:hypothetical protein
MSIYYGTMMIGYRWSLNEHLLLDYGCTADQLELNKNCCQLHPHVLLRQMQN